MTIRFHIKHLLLAMVGMAALVFIVGTATGSSDYKVQAWYCSGGCDIKQPCECKKRDKNGKCISYPQCGVTCGPKLQGGETWCGGGKTAACTCVGGDCRESGGQSCSNLGAVCPACSCDPVSCPPGSPPTKFMTRPISNGNGVRCNGCDGQTYACDPTHANTPPVCSILPGNIVIDRQDDPKQFALTVTDNDWGDAVEITGIKILDVQGQLNSCAQITGTSGQSLLGAVVRPGRSDSDKARISETTNFLVDARESHGVYTRNANGRSVCQGILNIEIRDLDSDGAGPDKSDVAVCKVNVTVTNHAPTVSGIRLEDRDTMTAMRTSGNLINGTDTIVNVGSRLTTANKFRAYYCKETLANIMPITCPVGAEEYLSGVKNPLFFEFTVTDRNGANDIMQAGVWLQLRETGKNSNVANFPLVGAQRFSFQALYSEKETLKIGAFDHFTSRGCLTEACGPLNMTTSPKTVFTGLGRITSLGNPATVGSKNGNLYMSQAADRKKSATTNEWHRVGYPDCLVRGGCNNTNVPAVAKLAATADTTLPDNYAWAIGADENNMLCYPKAGHAPTVVAASSSNICPANCAACIKREGMEAKGTDSITYRFGLYFNDGESSTGQGMPSGDYSLLISALDKVGAPLYQVEGKGPEGWTLFDKFGEVCQGASCVSGNGFRIRYDTIAPQVTVTNWSSNADNETVRAVVSIVDNTGGSGVRGVTNRFLAFQNMVDGEPSGTWEWTKKEASDEDFDGKNDHQRFTGSSMTLIGRGMSSGDEIVAGLCAYDAAGNMGCGKNAENYVFLANWMKTSFGNIYSGTGSSAPFSMSLPSNQVFNGNETRDETRKESKQYSQVTIYSPYSEQEFTVGTGLLLSSSGASNSGLLGGKSSGSTQTPLGFLNNYRQGSGTTVYNFFSLTSFSQGNEFERLQTIAKVNCQLLNAGNPGTCTESSSISELGSNNYTVLTVNSASISSDLVCKKVNVIFITGDVRITGNLTKENEQSGCLFVVGNGGSLSVQDRPSGQRTEVSGGKGAPIVDQFHAGIVGTNGSTVSFKKPETPARTGNDRLEIHGWVYTVGKPANFLRDLAAVDNRRFPAEWIIYDATLLDVLRPLVGFEKTADLLCGTSGHVLCQSQ